MTMKTLRAHSLHDFGAGPLADLRARLGDEVVLTVGGVDQAIPDAARVGVLIAGRPQRAHVAACTSLRAVVVPWAGVGAATFELLRAFPELALHNLHHNAGPTAEHALALLLAAAKRIVPSDRRMRAHDWKDRGSGQTAVCLDGERAVVLGMGAIGERVARLLGGVGMHVTGVCRAAAPGEQRGGVPVVGVDALAGALDGALVLVVCVPLTDATRGMVGAAELALLAPGAVLVNVARGPVIDERALFAALQGGRLHGAGLDVWYRYPRPGEERTPPSALPFEDLPGVVMSPHRAGSADATERLRAAALADVLLALARGVAAPGRVDVARGY